MVRAMNSALCTAFLEITMPSAPITARVPLTQKTMASPVPTAPPFTLPHLGPVRI